MGAGGGFAQNQKPNLQGCLLMDSSVPRLPGFPLSISRNSLSVALWLSAHLSVLSSTFWRTPGSVPESLFFSLYTHYRDNPPTLGALIPPISWSFPISFFQRELPHWTPDTHIRLPTGDWRVWWVSQIVIWPSSKAELISSPPAPFIPSSSFPYVLCPVLSFYFVPCPL